MLRGEKSMLYEFVKKIGISIIKFYDKYTSKRIKINVLDLIIKQGELSFIQFLTVTRYLDIENYYSDDKNHMKDAFRWQNMISGMAYGNKHNIGGGKCQV